VCESTKVGRSVGRLAVEHYRSGTISVLVRNIDSGGMTQVSDEMTLWVKQGTLSDHYAKE